MAETERSHITKAQGALGSAMEHNRTIPETVQNFSAIGATTLENVAVNLAGLLNFHNTARTLADHIDTTSRLAASLRQQHDRLAPHGDVASRLTVPETALSRATTQVSAHRNLASTSVESAQTLARRGSPLARALGGAARELDETQQDTTAVETALHGFVQTRENTIGIAGHVDSVIERLDAALTGLEAPLAELRTAADALLETAADTGLEQAPQTAQLLKRAWAHNSGAVERAQAASDVHFGAAQQYLTDASRHAT